MTELESDRLIVFDSKVRENFYPFSLTRPVFDLLCGSKSILEGIETGLGRKASDVIVPKYLEQVCKEAHPSLRVNEDVPEPCYAVSSAINPKLDIRRALVTAGDELGSNFILSQEGDPIAGHFDQLKNEALTSTIEGGSGIVRKEIGDVNQSYNSEIVRYPWQLLSLNGEAVERDFQNRGEMTAESENSSIRLLGGKVWISPQAAVEDFVVLDSSKGAIIIDDGSVIGSFTKITGPAFVGKRTVIHPSSKLSRCSVGDDCRIGGEVEESIILDFSNKPHEGFLGHSIIGSWTNLGALTTVSDLKNTYGTIKVRIGKDLVNTGLVKVGCFIADMCKTAIGTLIYSGKTIGVSSHLFGEVAEDVPSFTIFKNAPSPRSAEVYIDSAIETQRRMMRRRGQTMSEAYSEMMKSIHFTTSKDRTASNVPRNNFTLV